MQERNICKYENVEILASFNRTCSLTRQSIAWHSPTQIHEKQPRYGLMIPKKHWPFGNQVYTYSLVVWNIFNFPFHIWVVILPIDELTFFRGVGQPPTSIYIYIYINRCGYGKIQIFDQHMFDVSIISIHIQKKHMYPYVMYTLW